MENIDTQPTEDAASLLRKLIDEAEKNMVEMCGMKLYKKEEGFTQSDFYNMCGQTDSVVTITFRPGSESEELYGSDITVCIVYTRLQREQLEKDAVSLNDCPYVKAKYLLFDLDKEKRYQLLTKGFKADDAISLIVLENSQKENYFTSEDDRALNKMEIPFEVEGGGNDIQWIYGFLKKLRNEGVALTDDEMTEFLTYNLILEPASLTEDEREQIFDEQGRISNNDIAWAYLKWKREANKLTETDKQSLSKLSVNRMYERLGKLDKALKGIGGLKNFSKKYPEKCKLIIDKVLHFRDLRFNVTGKHLFCLDLDGFLHVYLRHVRELKIEGLYSERTKFQLEENDVLFVTNQVLSSINEEYQLFREANPTRKYRRYSDEAIYFNGDYYRVEVNSDGHVETFFKEDVWK